MLLDWIKLIKDKKSHQIASRFYNFKSSSGREQIISSIKNEKNLNLPIKSWVGL